MSDYKDPLSSNSQNCVPFPAMGGSPPPLAFCCLPYVGLLPCPPLQPANVWLVLANVCLGFLLVLWL